MAGPNWNERYAGADFLFGEKPNVFLAASVHHLKPGGQVLAVADGDGRNGVWLAEQGFDVLSADSSSVAQEKARAFAARRNFSLRFELADLQAWPFPENAFDAVVGIFIQFAGPDWREQLFANMKRSLKPGGVLLLTGYRPEQIDYGTGGPRDVGHLYTEEFLRKVFGDFAILQLDSHDMELHEGSGHDGMSALIDLVARKPA
ncbi:Tellurite methyltransferase [Hartmannibacter diazotrophicus]|uniref:Tellurite methyltransferase n=1 Tax=Hartmannibacter diazotrophicus TaxID=1482074 RepID=A0A2C9D3F6_9HYPH|nr:class I SAM-dependent methyltransferase [Hartmannibacter diazotrophicus]SON54719.1 Tellurite methyltransferase [Hartmannibacter diazotrophicus]